MSKNYQAQKVDKPINIDANWEKPIWQQVSHIDLLCPMGPVPEFTPTAQAKLRWDTQNIYVIFHVRDKYVKAIATEYNQDVCRDSCVEFFFCPDTASPHAYFNLETNCITTILMRHQLDGGKNAKPLNPKELDKIKIAASLPKLQPIKDEITTELTWTLEYALPLNILTSYSRMTPPAPGIKWPANFYKCADYTSNPHWLTWSEIPLPQPNFHAPRHFGTLEFTNNKNTLAE